MLKIRRPLGRLIFNMGIAIPGKTVFLIEMAPCGIFLLSFIVKMYDIMYVKKYCVLRNFCNNFLSIVTILLYLTLQKCDRVSGYSLMGSFEPLCQFAIVKPDIGAIW